MFWNQDRQVRPKEVAAVVKRFTPEICEAPGLGTIEYKFN
jgi:hypothetical protein